jgi:hypothetical protein
MEALATVVFERTPKGAVAIKSTGDEVPRRLRTLLLAVDGRSPVAQYVPFLTAFAPLSEKFAELEDMGYLKRKGSVTTDAVDRFERAQNSGFGALLPRIDAKSADSGFVAIQETDLRALATSPVARQNGKVVNAFELELQALARQMSGAAAMGAPAAASQQADVRANIPMPITAPAAPQLPDLLREMERFLSKSAGAEALPVVLMLEQIKTLAQLRAELPGYVELVQRYGSEADQHIERLAGLLDQAGN